MKKRDASFQYDDDRPIKEEILLMAFEQYKHNKKDKYKVKRRKKKNTYMKVSFIVIFFVCISSLVYGSIKLYNWNLDNKKTKSTVNEFNDIADITDISDGENINEPNDKTSDYWYYIKFPMIEVDFNDLIKKNKDTVGWININNTNINYPIVQTDNNDYYLTHSYDKSSNEAGWVFMDYRNNKNLNNKNTILYAHSRLDKTMFGSLSKVLKENWYKNKDNHIIKLSTPDENSLWQIFSVYKIKEENYYITTEFNDSDYSKFLNTIKSRSKYNFNVNLNTTDSILTLSTCYSDTERTVVHAKKIKKSSRAS